MGLDVPPAAGLSRGAERPCPGRGEGWPGPGLRRDGLLTGEAFVGVYAAPFTTPPRLIADTPKHDKKAVLPQNAACDLNSKRPWQQLTNNPAL